MIGQLLKIMLGLARIKPLLVVFLLTLFYSTTSIAQVANPFDVRYTTSVQGDYAKIANNILSASDPGFTNVVRDVNGNFFFAPAGGLDPNDDFNWASEWRFNRFGNLRFVDNFFNDSENMQYIDIDGTVDEDGDGNDDTFSSSSADLNLDQCQTIQFAGLYWSAILRDGDRAANTDYNQIKVRYPGDATYRDITADEIIFDTPNFGNAQGNFITDPYACFKDVTADIQALGIGKSGTYTVANINASLGSPAGGGASGGWTLVVVYQDVTQTNKNITVFDGFAGINNTIGGEVDFAISGFETIPTGPVRARIGVATLEGDLNLGGDQLRFRADDAPTTGGDDGEGFYRLSDAVNPATNFFNSNISEDGAYNTTRSPASLNTLGFDSDLFTVDNPSNNRIGNRETGVTLRLDTDRDSYFVFHTAFAIEIIEPQIQLIKESQDALGNNINNTDVGLGQQIFYNLAFQNLGNDSATNYVITDNLPINTIFDPATAIITSNPPGLIGPSTDGTTDLIEWTYDDISRQIIFNVDESLVTTGGAQYEINFQVQVVPDCFTIVDACNNVIQNTAFSSYQGVISGNTITDDPSFNSIDACNFGISGSTNFLTDLDDCNQSRVEILCDQELTLTASTGYTTYTWFLNGNQVGTGPQITVTQPGTYTIDKTLPDPCIDVTETIVVEFFDGGVPNPVLDVADDVRVCPNNGIQTAEIYLCGANASRFIPTNLNNVDSIEWQQLDETTCTAPDPDFDCPQLACPTEWNTISTANQFTAQDAGQYRLIVTYDGGCFRIFYFDVFKNEFDPMVTSQDIECNDPGNITVTNVSSDYEFSLQRQGDAQGPFQPSNSFDITQAGDYTVFVRQIDPTGTLDVTNLCNYTLDDIIIQDRDIDIDIITTDAACDDTRGSIRVQTNNVSPQYYYTLLSGASTVASSGPVATNDYTFNDVNPGTYDVRVQTDRGCDITEPATIDVTSDLALTAVVSQNVTCREGNIQVNATGGQTPYSYAIWSFNGTPLYADAASIPLGAWQTSVIFDISRDGSLNPYEMGPGSYEFIVSDRNNCTSISNEVNIIFEQTATYTITHTDITCTTNDGTITFNLDSGSSLNGYQVSFSIDNGVTFQSSGTFTGLSAGTYQAIFRLRKGGSECDSDPFEVVIDNPTPLTLAAEIQDDYTCLQQGSITVTGGTATGGTAPYEYSIDGTTFQSSPTFANLTDGTYSITVRDALGCEVTSNAIIIDPLNEPTDLEFTASTPTCPAVTADVTVSVPATGNGNPPFAYTIVAPAGATGNTTGATTGIFTSLAPDTYTFEVTDDKGCTYREDFIVNPITPIDVVGALDSNTTCATDSDGEITFTISGFTTDYAYEVRDAANNLEQNNATETGNTISLTGLPADTYTITVTDNVTNCTDTASVVVQVAPPLSVVATLVQPTCSAQGTVDVAPAGGWGGYSFELTGPAGFTPVTQTSTIFTGLTINGNYTVTVTDVNGCTAQDTFTLTPPDIPTLAIVPNSPCYTIANGLNITATASGGDGNYRYRINSGPWTAVTSSNNIFTGLVPGTFVIDVIDGNDCTAQETLTVNPELTVTASAPTITACGTTSLVTFSGAGGDGNYVFALVGDGVTPTNGDFSAATTTTATAPGNYDVYVRDRGGNLPTGGTEPDDFCEAQFDLVINQDPPINIDPLTKVDVTCNGDSSGSITAPGVTGGDAPYEYQLEIIDSSNAVLSIEVPYQTTTTFNNLAANNAGEQYQVRVRDNNNCEETATIIILEPDTLDASLAITQDYTCAQLGQITVTPVLTTGSGSFEYRIDGGAWGTTTTFIDLDDGTYTVDIRDTADTDCFITRTITIDPLPTPPTLTPAVAYNCDGSGNITISPTAIAPDVYEYQLEDTAGTVLIDYTTQTTNNVFNNVAVGNYIIRVNYGAGIATLGASCNLTIPVSVDAGNTFTAAITAFTNITCNPPGNDGSITIQAENFGPGGFEYSLDNFTTILGTSTSTAPIVIATNLTSQNYTVSVRDVDNAALATPLAGCAIDLPQTISQPDPVTIIASVTAPNTCLTDATITAVASDGTGPYTYQLENGAGAVFGGLDFATNGNNDTFPNLAAGTYRVRVRDANNCEEVSANVVVDPDPSFTAAVATPNDCYTTAGGGVILTVTTTDGAIPSVPPYTYSLNGAPAVASNTFTVNPGTYTVVVTDSYGCTATTNTIIIDPELSVSATAPDVSTCAVLGTDTIDFTISAVGGDTNYEYAVALVTDPVPADGAFTAGSTQTVTTETTAGPWVYRVYVRDNNAPDPGTIGVDYCQATFDVTVNQDPPLILNTDKTDVDCAGDSTGSVFVIAPGPSGGSGPYEYQLESPAGTVFSGLDFATNGTNTTFNNLPQGTYTVVIRDADGCTTTSVETVVEPVGLSLTASASDYTCAAEAQITIDAVGGGSGTYQFSIDGVANWQPAAGTATVPYTFAELLTDATYTVRVRDFNAPDCDFSVNVTVDPLPAEPTFTQTVVYNCDGSGNITVLPTAIAPDVYEYQLEDNTGTIITAPVTYDYATQGTNNVLANVPVGSYQIRINYGAGVAALGTSCDVTIPLVVEPGNEFRASFSNLTNVECFGESTGDIEIIAENFGSGGYQISTDNGTTFSGAITTSPVTISSVFGGGFAAGTYNIVVRDFDDYNPGPSTFNCEVNFPITITQPPILEALTVDINSIDTCIEDADITANAQGGTPPYSYQLEQAVPAGTVVDAFQTSPNFFGLNGVIRDYIIRVRDTNGCEDTVPVTIAPPVDVAFSAAAVDACYSGNNDAQIAITITNGNGGFQYRVNDGGAGNPWLTPSPAGPSGSGPYDGVGANPPPFVFTLDNLPAGTFVIEVKDQYGCEATPTQTVVINPQITALATLVKAETCSVPQAAQIDLAVNGGTGPYTFQISTDGGTTFNPYGAGTFPFDAPITGVVTSYIFRVIDSTNPTACTVDSNPIVVVPAQNPQFTVTPNTVLCNGDSTGVLDIDIDTNFGIAPYSIEVFEDTGGGVPGTSFGTQTTNLFADDYVVRVTDANGCFADELASITEPNAITFSNNVVPITCTPGGGGAVTTNGEVQIRTVAGGTAPYTYYITGNNGYSDTFVAATAGIDHDFDILNFGVYRVIIEDANGCFSDAVDIVASPPDDLDIDVSTATANCALGGTAIVSINPTPPSGNPVSGGPFFFAIYENPLPPFPNAIYQPADNPGVDPYTSTFTGLIPGVTYTFVVYDSVTECYYFEEATAPIDSPSNMNPVVDDVANVSCTGAGDGNVSFTLTNYDVGATDIEYQIFTSQSNTAVGGITSVPVNPPAPGTGLDIDNAGALPPGIYYILFREIGGAFDQCTVASPNFTIVESLRTVEVIADSPANATCNPVGIITAQGRFGTPPYTYQFLLATDPPPTATDAGWISNSSATGLAGGNYVVYVRDDFGCVASDPITVNTDPLATWAVTLDNNCGITEGNFAAIIELTNPATAIGPFSIELNGGPRQTFVLNGANQFQVTNLTSGAYNYILYDGNGCPTPGSLTIQPPLQFNASLTDLLTCIPTDAEITVSNLAGSGLANYTYEVFDSGGGTVIASTPVPSDPFTLNVSAADTYTVTITDNNAFEADGTTPCERSIDVVVPAAVDPILNVANFSNVTCNGADDGTIIVNVPDNGQAPYTFTIIADSPVGSSGLAFPYAPSTANNLSATFTALPGATGAGITYTIRVEGQNSCFDTATQTIIQPDAVAGLVATPTQFVCAVGTGNSFTNALVDASGVTGGTVATPGAYTYQFYDDNGTPAVPGDDILLQSGLGTQYIETDTAGRGFRVVAIDDNGCTVEAFAVINPYIQVTDPGVTINTAVTCNNNDGDVTITFTQNPIAPPAANVRYSVVGTDNVFSSVNQASNNFTGLPQGNFDVTISIFDPIANIPTGCEVQTSFELVDPDNVEVAADIDDVVCIGTDGAVRLTVSDPVNAYAGGFDYQIFDTQGTIATGDDTPVLGPVNSPTAGPTANIPLPEGQYRVTITQTASPFCATETTFAIAGPPAAITATLDTEDITCNPTNNGIVQAINVAGGWGGYEYQLEDGVGGILVDYTTNGTNPRFTGLAAGDYIIRIRDSRGCEEPFGPVTLSDPVPLAADLQINQQNCTNNEGILQVFNIVGGQPGLGNETFQLQIETPLGSGTFVDLRAPQTNDTFSNLGDGNYRVVVTDQWGCAINTPERRIFDEIVPQAQVVKLIDCDATDPGGQITITAAGGTGAYTYAITAGPVINTTGDATGIYTGLTAAGTYTFTITDAGGTGCFKTIDQELLPPIVPTVNIDDTDPVTCNGDNDGTITVSAPDNGIGPYTFVITGDGGAGSGLTFPYASNPVQDTPLSATFINLPGSAVGITYTIEVTAANSCTATNTATITEPAVINGITTDVTQFACTSGNNLNNATIAVTGAVGGSSNYVRYEFIYDNGTPAPGDDITQDGSATLFTVSNPAGGDVTINVYDDNGCQGTTTETIIPFIEIVAPTVNITTPVTCANDDAVVEIGVTINNPGPNTPDLTYQVVGDNNGYNVSQNETTATSTFTGVGFDITTGVTNYTITVTNNVTGCFVQTTFQITNPNTFDIAVATTPVICLGDSNGSATFTFTDPIGGYAGVYNWAVFDTNGTPANLADDIAGPTGTSASPTTGTVLASGQYRVVVTQVGVPTCEQTELFNIAEPPAGISGDRDVTQLTCNGNDGIIEIRDLIGGYGGYLYYISTTPNPDPTNPANYTSNIRETGLPVGTYEIWVIDSMGCFEQLANAVLVDPTPLAADLVLTQPNCTGQEGEIQVTNITGGQPGVGNETFQLQIENPAGSGTFVNFRAAQTSDTFSNLGGGTYQVVVSDQWDCSVTTASIIIYDEIIPAVTVVKPITCTAPVGGEITVTQTGGSGTFNYEVLLPDLSTQSNATGVFANLTLPGTYTFTITDTDAQVTAAGLTQCSKTISQNLAAPINPALDPAIVVNVTCNGLTDGTITAVLQASTANDGPYTYELYQLDAFNAPILPAFRAAQGDPRFTGLPAGNYQVRAISAKGCDATRNETVGEPTPLIIDASAPAFTCTLDNVFGSTILTVSILNDPLAGTPSGTGPYLYSIDNVNYQTSNTFTIIDTGVDQTITAYVRDANSCPQQFDVDLDPINKFTVAIGQTQEINCARPEQIQISVTETIADANPGTYTYELLPIGNPNGTQTATTATTADYDLTAVGTYNFRVTDTSTGCFVDTPYTIAPFDFIEARAFDPTQVCFGDTNGTVQLEVTGYTGDYRYELLDQTNTVIVNGTGNTGTNPLTVSNLPGGVYSIRVIETLPPVPPGTDNCDALTGTFRIIEPSSLTAVNLTVTRNLTCDPGSDALITAVGSGGYGGYEYQFDEITALGGTVVTNLQAFDPNGTVGPLAAGFYRVTTRDDGGCTAVDELEIVTPLPLAVTAVGSALLCNGDLNGTVSATPVTPVNEDPNNPGTFFPVNYVLNVYEDATSTNILSTSTTQTSPDFTNLPAGFYTVTVNDALNCGTESNRVEVVQPDEVAIQAFITRPLSCTQDAEITVSATGGSGTGYQYRISAPAAFVTPFTTTTTYDLPVGDYQFEAIDSNTCLSVPSAVVSIMPIPDLVLDVDRGAAFVNCFNDNSAIISATATGSLGNYMYTLVSVGTDAVGTNVNIGPQPEGLFRDLYAGTYDITVMSEDCPPVTDRVTIINPPELLAQAVATAVSCPGEDDGTITITYTGGTERVLFSISPNLDRFDDQATFTDLEPGIYDIIVSDGFGCPITLQAEVIEPAPIDVNVIDVQQEICGGDDDGFIEVGITGGTRPYRVSITGPAGPFIAVDDTGIPDTDPVPYTFVDLSGDRTYTILVLDANDCEATVSETLLPPTDISAVAALAYNCDANTYNIGVTLNNPQFRPTTNYTLTGNGLNITVADGNFTDIPPGDDYVIEVVEGNSGCNFFIRDIDLLSYEPVEVEAEQSGIDQFVVQGSGGRAPYQYNVNGGDFTTNNVFTVLDTGVYTVTIRDANGCEAQTMIEFEYVDIFVPNYFSPNGDGIADYWYPERLEFFPNAIVEIYDRYARLLIRYEGNQLGWDGNYENKPLPSGDYWYVVKLNDGRTSDLKGHFTLYR
ncbi:T9SS type B sorting domain-containing protein [Spongiivirga citrea]|uniref:T9SS type B sorting domain-containing protein n=1 Tax=Spongiivirga citrea TaxID=1481457 RepID=A0A6M0CHU0_9FLAO|nr:T9SS type B sorting domain-containing protein [Spongiivirga citrea]NER17431.1 T9SS type B sorting domain-containing protein [Spongiivirga citrea]